MGHAWITGAHGFIGRHLARALRADGFDVAGLGHGTWPTADAASWGVSHWLNGEVSASNLLQLQTALGNPELVFHLAGGSSVGLAIANPREDFHRTVVSTADLLEWLRQSSPGTRLVAVSSGAVYGAGHAGAIAEDAALRPVSPYGAHKLVMEELCRSYAASYGVQTIVPRLFSVYGSGLRKQLLWDLCGKLASGAEVELAGTGRELRDWTDVRDVSRSLIRVAAFATAQAPAINIASGVASAVSEIAAIVANHWDVEARRERVRFSGRARPGDPFCLVADVGLMKSRGIEPGIPVARGVADYVAWFRTQLTTHP
jgi:UDP-glucose 4-epimerase